MFNFNKLPLILQVLTNILLTFFTRKKILAQLASS